MLGKATPVSAHPNEAPHADEVLLRLNSLFNETATLFLRMRAVLEQLHRQGELTGVKRSILGDLDRLGSQTVPQMARARATSRQHIQPLVNSLAQQGWVEFVENAAHKRSPLMRVTPQGRELLAAMYLREAEMLRQLEIPIPLEDLQTAVTTLRSVRELLESSQVRHLLESQQQECGGA